MSRSNWRFFGCFVLLSGALILSLTLPQAAFSQGGDQGRVAREVQALEAKLQEQQAQLQEQVAKFHEEKEKFARALQEAHRELEQRRQDSMPPLEQSKTRVFNLQHIDGRHLGNTLIEILGGDRLRKSAVSPHKLVVSANEEILATVESLIAEMDKPEVVSKSEDESTLPRSLMVRIFWLSDGPTNPDAQLAEEFLPDSVIKALQPVGLEEPFVVLQSNTSIALEENENEARFEVENLSAIIFNDRLMFNAEGIIHVAGKNRVRLQMHVATTQVVGLNHYQESQVSGSVIAPLYHFVVLGTANHASSQPDSEGNYSSSRFAYVVEAVEAFSYHK